MKYTFSQQYLYNFITNLYKIFQNVDTLKEINYLTIPNL